VRATRASIRAARIRGAEFVVLVDDATLQCAPELVAERILDVMFWAMLRDDHL
jgi:GGDEF domain-containing protein